MTNSTKLADRIQSAIYALCEGKATTFHAGNTANLLRDCLGRINRLTGTVERYHAAEKYYKNQPPIIKYRELIRNLAAKIRRQKAEINNLKQLYRHEHYHARSLLQINKTLRQQRVPLDCLYENVYVAAKKGDVVRILALLSDWEARGDG